MPEPLSERGWREDLAAVAVTVGELLVLGVPPWPAALSDPSRTLAARDRVVAGLRALLAVGHAPVADDGPVTLTDLTVRPGVALHAALGLLPTAAPVDRPAPSDPPTRPVPAYEQAWDRAAHGLLALEAHLDALPRPPSPAADLLLGDVADLAGTLNALDADLLRALPANRPAPLDGAARALADRAGHTAVRVTAAECRLRFARPGLPQAVRSPLVGADAVVQRREQHLPVGLVGLAGATGAVTDLLTRRGGQLSAVELRAVAGLLESGAAHAASTLRRAAPALPAAAHLAEELLAVPPAAEALRRSPVRSLSPPRRALPLLAGQIRGQLARLAALSSQLPPTTPSEDLHRLARPALTWAGQVAPLTDALTAAVRDALAAGLLAVPADVRSRGRTALLWAPASASPDPPRVLTRVTELRAATRQLPHRVQAVTLSAPSRSAGTAAHPTSATALRAAVRSTRTPAGIDTGLPGRAAPLPEHPPRRAVPGSFEQAAGHNRPTRAR